MNKLFIRRYLLTALIATLTISGAFMLIFITESFKFNWLNQLIITLNTLINAMLIRIYDDTFDFDGDKIKGKVLFNQKILYTLIISFMAIGILLSLQGGLYLQLGFLALLQLSFANFYIKGRDLHAAKVLLLPLILIIFYFQQAAIANLHTNIYAWMLIVVSFAISSLYYIKKGFDD